MKKWIAGVLLSCLLGLTACGQEEVLYMGLNGEIVEIDAEGQVIFVSDPEPVREEIFGERCAIDCGEAPVIYCDYGTGDVKDIAFETLEVGDAVILSIYESNLDSAPEGPVKAEQVQLGTQRLS